MANSKAEFPGPGCWKKKKAETPGDTEQATWAEGERSTSKGNIRQRNHFTTQNESAFE